MFFTFIRWIYLIADPVARLDIKKEENVHGFKHIISYFCLLIFLGIPQLTLFFILCDFEIILHNRQLVAYNTKFTLSLIFFGHFQVLIGNKTDLTDNRVITTDEGIALGTKLGIPFIESSAKTGENVTKIFETLIRCTPRTSMEYKVIFFDIKVWY